MLPHVDNDEGPTSTARQSPRAVKWIPDTRSLIQVATLGLLAFSVIQESRRHEVWVKKLDQLQERLMSVKESYDKLREERRLEVERISHSTKGAPR